MSGLGVGIAAEALQVKKHVLSTTLVEIDPAPVYDAARRFHQMKFTLKILEVAIGLLDSPLLAIKHLISSSMTRIDSVVEAFLNISSLASFSKTRRRF